MFLFLVDQVIAGDAVRFNLENVGQPIASIELNTNGGIKELHVINGNFLAFTIDKEATVYCYLLNKDKVKLHNAMFSRFVTLDRDELSVVLKTEINALEILAKDSIIRFWKLQKKNEIINLTEPKDFSVKNLDFRLRNILIREKNIKVDSIELKKLDMNNKLDRELFEEIEKALFHPPLQKL